MNKFIKGLELSELFYKECIKEILDKYFPDLKYSAGLIGAGSEILGFDTPISTDHNWGPRLFIFLTEDNRLSIKDKLSETLSDNLPDKFYGYPINFKFYKNIGFTNGIEIFSVKSFFQYYLDINPYEKITALDWLTFKEHKLLTIIKGKIFYDGLNELNEIRSKFSYYPKDIWLYLMASQWKRIAQERAFMGRCGDVGDELGSTIIASRLVRDLMRLCFLIEKQYAPYNKWFGSAFSELKCADYLEPIMVKAIQSGNWKIREQYLCKAYTHIAEMHNDLHITKPLNTEVSNYYDRPYLVINADDFVDAIFDAIEDKEIKNIKYKIGSVNQFADCTDLLDNAHLCRKLQDIYF